MDGGRIDRVRSAHKRNAGLGKAKAAFFDGEADMQKLAEMAGYKDIMSMNPFVEEWTEELIRMNRVSRENLGIVVPDEEREVHREAMETFVASMTTIQQDLAKIESQERTLELILDRLATHPDFSEVSFEGACKAVELANQTAKRRSELLKDLTALFKTWKAETALAVANEATLKSIVDYERNLAKEAALVKARERNPNHNPKLRGPEKKKTIDI